MNKHAIQRELMAKNSRTVYEQLMFKLTKVYRLPKTTALAVVELSIKELSTGEYYLEGLDENGCVIDLNWNEKANVYPPSMIPCLFPVFKSMAVDYVKLHKTGTRRVRYLSMLGLN